MVRVFGLLVALGFFVACGPGREEEDQLRSALEVLVQEMGTDFRIDPAVVFAREGLVEAGTEGNEIAQAMRAVGIARGDAIAAQECAEFRASLGVPDVAAASPAPPPGCRELLVPVFAVRAETTDQGLLLLRGTGWSWERAWRLSLTVSADGEVAIEELVSKTNLY